MLPRIYYMFNGNLNATTPCKRTQHCCQQLLAFLDVTCCIHLHTLLHVVAQSVKPVKLLSQKLPTFLLFRDRQSVAKQQWIRLHSSSNIVGATHTNYTWSTKSYIVGSCRIRLHTTANTDVVDFPTAISGFPCKWYLPWSD